MNKAPVLVTGGAGYIGSHAMLALKDAGWSVSVIDNLSNGVREAVPEGVPFYEGNIADAALVKRIFAEQGIRAIMHFAGIDRGPGIGREAALLLLEQHDRDARAGERCGRGGSRAHPLFLDRRGLRRPRESAGGRG